MPKLRLGVVLLVPPPFDREIDTLRRATGDGTFGRVPAHVTLVPPVNVPADRFEDALAVLREAAQATRPFTAKMGAATTFLPDNPVLYLPVEGDGAEAIVALRERVFCDPLSRPLTWPFVPHITLADEASPERIAAAQVALADYQLELSFDRVHLLRESDGRIWVPVADAAFAAPSVIGRGGLPLEISVSRRPDPEAVAFAQVEGWPVAGDIVADPERVAIVARRDGVVVGIACGSASDGTAHLEELLVAAAHRRQGIGSHLLAAFESWAAEQGCHRLFALCVVDSAQNCIYEYRGWREDLSLLRWRRDL